MNNDPIIVGGFYRSGTSLFRRLLDAHSMIHCPPEIKLWRDMLQDYLDDPYAHLRLAKTLEVLPLPTDVRFNAIGKAYVSLREASLKVLNKTVWADKDPENARYLHHWKNVMGSNFRYIHVARHPLDTLTSCIEANFVKTLPAEPELILHKWQDNCRAFLDFTKQNKQQCYVIHYEKLVSDPVAELTKVFGWLLLPFEEEVLATFSSSQRGFGIEDAKVGQSKTVHQSSVMRWQRQFTELQAQKLMQPIEPCYQQLIEFSHL